VNKLLINLIPKNGKNGKMETPEEQKTKRTGAGLRCKDNTNNRKKQPLAG
jgi:hypothetical protein